MSELTPEKIRELTSLLASAPPATAARLLAMFERMKIMGSQVIPSNDLIVAMREAGMTSCAGHETDGVRLPSFARLFLAPFENLFEDGALDGLLPGSIPRAGLKEVWQLIAGRFAADDVADMEPLGRAAILRGDIDGARKFTANLRAALLKRLAGKSNEAIAHYGKTAASQAVLRRLVPLMVAETTGRDVWAAARVAKGELSDLGMKNICHHIRLLEDTDPDAARELILLTMTTLPRPAEALRVLNRVSNGDNDTKLDITNYAVIGRRVIAFAARCARQIEDAAQQVDFDGAALAATVDRYSHHLLDLEREVTLSHDGPWQQAIFAIRSRVGNRLEILCEEATTSLEAALPLQRVQRHNFAWTQEPRFDIQPCAQTLDFSVRHIAFVAASRLFAPLAGFGASRDKAAKHVASYLNLVSEAVLLAARQTQRPRHFDAWVEAAASLLEAFEGVKVAHVFERRIAAMSHAA